MASSITEAGVQTEVIRVEEPWAYGSIYDHPWTDPQRPAILSSATPSLQILWPTCQSTQAIPWNRANRFMIGHRAGQSVMDVVSGEGSAMTITRLRYDLSRAPSFLAVGGNKYPHSRSTYVGLVTYDSNEDGTVELQPDPSDPTRMILSWETGAAMLTDFEIQSAHPASSSGSGLSLVRHRDPGRRSATTIRSNTALSVIRYFTE